VVKNSFLSFILHNLSFSFLVRFENQLFYFLNSRPFSTNPLQTLMLLHHNPAFLAAKKSPFSLKSRFSETGIVNFPP